MVKTQLRLIQYRWLNDTMFKEVTRNDDKVYLSGDRIFLNDIR